MSTRTEIWRLAEDDGRKFYVTVRVTGLPYEPTGVVEISYELLSQMLTDLGYVPDES